MENNKMENCSPEQKQKLSTKDRLIQSGIAERMIESIKKNRGEFDPEITFGVEDCNFRVEHSVEESQPGETEVFTQVVIEMPNLNPGNSEEHQPMVSHAFGVGEGGNFGAYGEPPLTTEQLDVIKNIVN